MKWLYKLRWWATLGGWRTWVFWLIVIWVVFTVAAAFNAWMRLR